VCSPRTGIPHLPQGFIVADIEVVLLRLRTSGLIFAGDGELGDVVATLDELTGAVPAFFVGVITGFDDESFMGGGLGALEDDFML